MNMVTQLGDIHEDVKATREQVNAIHIELAVLKTKVSVISSIGGILGGALAVVVAKLGFS